MLCIVLGGRAPSDESIHTSVCDGSKVTGCEIGHANSDVRVFL